MTGHKLYRWLRDKNYPKGFEIWCFNCNCHDGKRYTQRPAEFISKYQKHYFTKYLPILLKSKEKCLDHYGRKCTCCGETNPDWLTIEHKSGKKGALHPKGYGGIKLFHWLLQHGFPKNFEIMCYNCNLVKGNHKICPHQESKCL